MTDELDAELIALIEAGDEIGTRRRLLETIADTRQSIGLPTTDSTLSTMQLAATYRRAVGEHFDARGVGTDYYSACALGRRDIAPDDAELALQAEGLTPLGIAIVNGHVETVTRLLEIGDDPNRPQSRAAFFAWEDIDDPLEWLPIHLASAHGYRDESVTIVDLLIDAGADIRAYCPLGETPLHLASTFNWLPIIERLLRARVWVDERTVTTFERVAQYASPTNDLPADSTALHVAAREGRTPAVDLLIARGANIDAQDEKGRTPLHEAASPWWGENTDVIERLLAAGADRGVRDRDGRTPRGRALERSFARSADLLA